jgi:hypothetical protein
VGFVYGILGWLWATRATVVAAVAVGLAFVFEPLIVLGLLRAGVWGGGGLLDYPWLWASEVAIGLAAVAYALIRSQARMARPG